MMPSPYVPTMLGDVLPRLFIAARAGDPVLLTEAEHAVLELNRRPGAAIADHGIIYPLDELTYHIIPNNPEEWTTT